MTNPINGPKSESDYQRALSVFGVAHLQSISTSVDISVDGLTVPTVTGAPAGALSISVAPADGTFTVMPASCQPTAAQPCALSVFFHPKQLGAVTGSVAVSDAANNKVVVQLSGAGVTCCKEVTSTPNNHFCILLAVVLAYFATLVIVRWNMVACPTRNLLRAQVKALNSQIATLELQDPANVARLAPVKGLLTECDAKMTLSVASAWLEVLFWSRGNEIAGWGLAHEAEAHLAPFLSNDELRAGLERAEADLRQLTDKTAIVMADKIAGALALDSSSPTAASAGRWKALLSEARGILYDHMDTKFATLVSWQNKTSWLVSVGLMLIVALAASLQHETLFLLGATGGLLSRLSRSLNRADVPTDYGASWTTLFLSPVAGALSAWCGILLAVVAVKLNVLGPAFSSIVWCDACSPMVLGLAILLGFSERAFDGILTQLESKVQPAAKPASPPDPVKSPAGAAPPTPKQASPGDQADDDDHVDGCNVPIERPTADKDLPASKGGVA